MTTTTTTTSYTVILKRPSRSKCPNAWARIEGQDGWLGDTFSAAHGTRIILGGTVRRATRSEKIVERVTIDETGSWGAWGGAGSITIAIA